MGDHPSARFFFVFRGWCPGIYTFVEDFNEQIRDYEEPSYQIHTTADEAARAWNVYFGNRRHQLSMAPNYEGDIPPPYKPPEIRHLERIALHALHERHAQEMLNKQNTTTGPVREMVPEKPNRRIIAYVNVGSLLIQACRRLQMPDPIYRLLRLKLQDGRRGYKYLVSLVPPKSSKALIVLSRVSADCNECRSDAARLGLRHLCQVVSGYVEDYSRDLVQIWRSRYGEEVGGFFQDTEARMNDLVLRNQQLGEHIQGLEGELRSAQRGNNGGSAS
ncbi:hypothetical protein PIB30_073156 [Stylosanthes scabra]|uniref:Uncharacterized protein n=1 Tax=Stylosanthes scabra TaxID=79078 RepID=A0ABU6VPJ5_9FABA|nr:hypothetical protein [Stylosanthes scabra]